MRVKCDALDSYIDEETLTFCLFGHKIKFNEEQFFIVKSLYKLYDEEYKKNNVQDKVQILKLTKEIQDLKQEKQKAS